MGSGKRIVLKSVAAGLFAFGLQTVAIPSPVAKSTISRTMQEQLDLLFIEKTLSHRLRDTPTKEIQAAAKIVVDGARYMNIDPLFILAIVAQESSFRPRVIGGVGEVGLMQLRPKTAAWILQKNGGKWKGRDSLFNPVENIRIGVLYLTWLSRKFDDPRVLISAFNMGHRNAQKFIKKNVIPQIYYNKVYAKYAVLRAEARNEQIFCPPVSNEMVIASNY